MASDELQVGSDYFALDDILASCARITCIIDNSIDSELFPLCGLPSPEIVQNKGIKAAVPLYMIGSLKEQCEISLPKAYNSAMQNVLFSHASTANLKQLQQYYYYVGMRLADLLDRTDGRTLSDCLLGTLIQRIGGVVSKALLGQSKLEKFDKLEERLFKDISLWRHDLIEWMNGGRRSNKRKHSILS